MSTLPSSTPQATPQEFLDIAGGAEERGQRPGSDVVRLNRLWGILGDGMGLDGMGRGEHDGSGLSVRCVRSQLPCSDGMFAAFSRSWTDYTIVFSDVSDTAGRRTEPNGMVRHTES